LKTEEAILENDFIVYLSFVIDEIVNKKNKKMLSIVLSILLILLVFDLIPIILKFIISRTIYESDNHYYTFAKKSSPFSNGQIGNEGSGIINNIYFYYWKAMKGLFVNESDSNNNNKDFIPKSDEYIKIKKDFENIFNIDKLEVPSLLDSFAIENLESKTEETTNESKNEEEGNNGAPKVLGLIDKFNKNRIKAILINTFVFFPILYIIIQIVGYFSSDFIKNALDTIAFFPLVTNTAVIFSLPNSIINKQMIHYEKSNN
jgi:hypothetical protein